MGTDVARGAPERRNAASVSFYCPSRPGFGEPLCSAMTLESATVIRFPQRVSIRRFRRPIESPLFVRSRPRRRSNLRLGPP